MVKPMTPRERMEAVLNRRQPDEVPTFELEFQLTELEFGQDARYYGTPEIEEASPKEGERMLHHDAQLFMRVAEHFGYSNIAFSHVGGEPGLKIIRLLRDQYTQGRYTISANGGGTYGIPNGKDMEQFVYDLYDKPEEMKEGAQRMVADGIEHGKRLIDAGCDIVFSVTDFAFNDGPFLSPRMFREFVTPYLAQWVGALKEYGAYVMIHTDGNLMAIMDQFLECAPHGLHSLDPQAGMDITVLKRKFGDRLCLMGNLACNLLQVGTAEQVAAAARNCILAGKPGGGYIFSTSNVVFRNATYPEFDPVVLGNYKVALKALREHGRYD